MAKGLGLPAFVAKANLGVEDVEMPGVGGQVHRLERAAAFLMQDVQRLDQAHVVAHLGKGAVAAATVVVHHIGRAANRAVDAEATPGFQAVVGIAGFQREGGGDGGKQGHDQRGVKADRVALHIGPGLGIKGAGGRVQDPHALPGQHVQRGGVDRGDLIVADHPDRGHLAFDLSERALRHAPQGAVGLPSAPLDPPL